LSAPPGIVPRALLACNRALSTCFAGLKVRSEPVILGGDVEHLLAGFFILDTPGFATDPPRFLAVVLSVWWRVRLHGARRSFPILALLAEVVAMMATPLSAGVG
jgi:hypothetical protein